LDRRRAGKAKVVSIPKEKSQAADYLNTESNSMDSLIDSVILGTALLFSFGAAFVAQSAALRLILKAMNRR